MRAFIDTSTLFKKYVEEPGSQRLERLLEDVYVLIVSPITRLEINSVLERRLRNSSILSDQAAFIEEQFERDYHYFELVLWNQNLEATGKALIRKHQLKVLDAIQLAAARLADCELFLVSDKRLSAAAAAEGLPVSVV